MRQVGIGLGLLLLLALVIPVAAFWLGGERTLDALRPTLERELSEVLNLRVTLSGPISVQFVPRPQLSAEGVRIANLPGRPSPSLLTVSRLFLELRILPLFRKMLVIHVLRLEEAELRIERDAEGNRRLQPQLDQLDQSAEPAPGDRIALSIQQLRINDLEVYFHLPGEAHMTSVKITQLALMSESVNDPLSLEVHGAFEGSAFAIEANTGSLSDLLEAADNFPIELRAHLPHSSVEAKGTLGNPRSLVGTNLPFQAKITDAAVRFWKVPIPALGPFTLSGTLTGREDAIGIDDLSLRSNHGHGIEIEIKGSIQDLVQAKGVDLHLHARAPDANLFRNLTSLTLPEVPVKVDLDLDDDDGSLGVKGALEFAAPGVFELLAQGHLDDLRKRTDLDLQVELKAKDLKMFSTAVTQKIVERLPALGPVKASGHVVLHGDRLGLQEIDIHIGDPTAIWLHATGAVGDLVGMHDVALEVRLSAASARRLAALYEREIPEIGSVAAAFSVHDADGSLGIENATLQVGDANGPFELSLSGGLDDLRQLKEVSLRAQLEAREPQIFDTLGGVDLPLAGPLAFRGEVRGSAGQLTIDGRVSAKTTSLQVSLKAHISPGERPRFDLRIKSPLIDLADILRPPLEETERSEHSQAAATSSNRDEALPFEFLRSFDANLLLTADRIHGYKLFDVQTLQLSAKLLAGRLSVNHMDASYEAGKISGKLEIDTRPKIPTARLELETSNVNLTKLISQFQAHSGNAGLLDLSVDLETHGTTALDLRSNIDGFFGAMLRDGTLANPYAKAVTFDILHVSIPGFATEPEAQPIQCLLALVPITHGVGRFEKLYLEGSKLTISGIGNVNIGTGQLDVRLTPEVHDPGLVSVATTVDLTGPIERPTITPVTRSMVTSALGALLRNATRPLRAVRDTIHPKTDEAEDPCAVSIHKSVAQMETEEVEPITLKAENATP